MSNQDDEIARIFFGKDNEPITEEIIAELVAQGMPEADIRQMAKDGFMYCRPRNSFISPPHFEGNIFKKRNRKARK